MRYRGTAHKDVKWALALPGHASSAYISVRIMFATSPFEPGTADWYSFDTLDANCSTHSALQIL